MEEARGVNKAMAEMMAMLDHFFLRVQVIALSGVARDSQSTILGH